MTAAILRFLEAEEGQYVLERDPVTVVEKMRAVISVLIVKGLGRVVLGAWGCGAYRNPVLEVAQAWRQALLSPQKYGKRGCTIKRAWPDLEYIDVAIPNAARIKVFKEAFDDVLKDDTNEEPPVGTAEPPDRENNEETAVKDCWAGRIDAEHEA